jgi:hypothetical protein
VTNPDGVQFDINNPETYPEDPEKLAQLLDAHKGDPAEGVDTAVDEAAKKAEEEAKAKADADAKAKADAEAKAKEEAERKAKEDADAKAKADAEAERARAEAEGKKTTPEGVLTADGKSVIPYGVLAATRRREEAERQRADKAEREAAESRSRVEELTAEAERLRKGEKTDPGRDEALAALEENIAALNPVPEVKAAFESLVGMVKGLSKTVEDLRGAREDDEARQQAAARERVQQAIDDNPTLRYWQNEKPDLFNEAVGYDRQMRENPNLRNLSLEQRFERVVKVMEGLHGPAELPEGYRKTDPKDKSQQTQQTQQQKDEKARTEVKAEDKGLTLSDLPGGAPPSSGAKALEEMTTGDIEESVNRMLDKGMSVQDVLSSYTQRG